MDTDTLIRTVQRAPRAVAPARAAQSAALYAMSDDALHAALAARGDSPPQRGPAESQHVAVPSSASDQRKAMSAVGIAVSPERGAWGPKPHAKGTQNGPNRAGSHPHPATSFSSNLTDGQEIDDDPDPWT